MNLYSFGKAVSYLLVRLLFSMRYQGLENIPSRGGYIVACNHRSNFDPLFIAHKHKRQIHYIAKQELLGNSVSAFFMRSFGVIPINRGAGDTGALEKSAELVQNGGVLGVFPEGHRSPDGKPLRPRAGIAVIAAKTGADILPCAVSYGERLGFRVPVTVRYGKLITHAELGIDPASGSISRTASRVVMDRIVSMLDYKGPPELPAKGQGE